MQVSLTSSTCTVRVAEVPVPLLFVRSLRLPPSVSYFKLKRRETCRSYSAFVLSLLFFFHASDEFPTKRGLPEVSSIFIPLIIILVKSVGANELPLSVVIRSFFSADCRFWLNAHSCYHHPRLHTEGIFRPSANRKRLSLAPTLTLTLTLRTLSSVLAWLEEAPGPIGLARGGVVPGTSSGAR